MNPLLWRSDSAKLIPPAAACHFAEAQGRVADLGTFRGAYHLAARGGEWFFRLRGGAHTYRLNHDGHEWTVRRFTTLPDDNTSPDNLSGSLKNGRADIVRVRIAE